MSLTPDQFEELLKRYYTENADHDEFEDDEEDYSDFSWHSVEWDFAQPVTVSGIVLQVEEQHGGEGQGDQLWIVVKATTPDGNVQYFRKSGWYASYDGGYYDYDLEEVFPKEILKTVWVTS